MPVFAPAKPRDPDNLEGELEPADTTLPDLEQDDEEDKIVNWVHEQHKHSAEAKRLLEQTWLLATAYEEGNQWVELKSGIGLRTLQDENDPARSYVTCNLIRPLKNKVKSRATMNKPDASVAPESDRPQDVAAAPEARDLLDHFDRLFKRQQQTRLWVDSTLITSTSFLKIGWDPNAMAPVPAQAGNVGPQGVVHQMDSVGQIFELVVPPWEIYPDPRARSWDEAGWIIHAKRYPLRYFAENYARGKWVKSDTVSTYEYMETRLDWVLGTNTRLPTGEKTALLLEMWQLPTPRYPKGRRIDVGGKVLLEYKTELPYDWCLENNRLPFVPLEYETRFGSLWAPNFVDRLISLQYYLNVALSRVQDRLNSDRMAVLVPEGTEIGVDAYESMRMLVKIHYKTDNPAAQPVYHPAPPINPEWFKVIEVYKGMMEDIAGVHEVSNGQVPAGVTAGNAIELLTQSDNTQMAEFVNNIEQAQATRAEIEIALAAQFYKEERLIAVSTQGDPQNIMRAVRSFEALRDGGRVRVTVTPGSATPKTPAARIQQYMDMAKAGMFQPQNLPMLKLLAQVMELDRSDLFAQHLDDVIQQVQSMQPDPAAVQQMKGQQALQAQQLDQQHAAGIEAVKTQGKIEYEQAKGQVLQGLEITKAQAKAAADGRLSAQEHQQALEAQQSDHHHDVAMYHAQSVVPTANIGIKVDPGTNMQIGIAEMLGLPSDDPDELKAMNAPKPQTPAKGDPNKEK